MMILKIKTTLISKTVPVLVHEGSLYYVMGGRRMSQSSYLVKTALSL